MSNGWGGGYVTDITYDYGYYREQSPQQLKLACLLSGVAWDVPEEGSHYLELGCGVGLGALVIAAANPSWRVTALDFNPAHIAQARGMAQEAGLDNITFIEADLTEFAEGPIAAALPPADVITSHGVWSWVAPEVRAGIVRLVHAKLTAGGAFHVSYNALPGWQGMLALQRLVRESGRRLAGRSDRQAQAGFGVLRELAAAEAQSFRGDSRLASWLSDHPNHSPTYLAHEFMNEHWAPCWHADVVKALSAARLDWVGSAGLVENFTELAMTGPQRAVYDRFEDPVMRELVKDMCMGRMLRHDVYVRGARRISAAARDAALRELTLALVVPAPRVQLEVQVAAGKAELSPAFYRPVVEMLADGPARVAALLKAPGAAATRENPAELAGLLVGTRQAVVVARPGAQPEGSAMRLNAVLARQLATTENLNRGVALASTAIGGGFGCSTSELFMVGRLLAGETRERMPVWSVELGEGLDEENQGRVRDTMQRGLDETLPLMRRLSCLPA
ncbi:MAG TPA: methyltransferase regulatory domain-containing protein [Falsiroseomonas sp.]|jgi:SAM-dependent methyltransferase|nr:methyltransferase regulatory domain-containing protein [Falsiroseomonas sp.]